MSSNSAFFYKPRNLGPHGVEAHFTGWQGDSQKLTEFFSLFYISYLNSQFIFTHVYLIDLGRPLSKSLGDPSMEPSTLLGIRVILHIGDLEFPILLNKSEDCERIIVDLIAVDSVERDSMLCWSLDLTIWDDVTDTVCGGTNIEDNFPWCFDHFANIRLG